MNNPVSLMITLLLAANLVWSCSPGKKTDSGQLIRITKGDIRVDGDTSDWQSVPATDVHTRDHLWLGQDLTEGAWDGPADLSYSWKAAWNNDKLYFLVEVTDDILSAFDQEYAWLNDCLEIYIDPVRSGGERIAGIGSASTLEERLGKVMRGYEMQFLPSSPVRVFTDDSRGVYYTHAGQCKDFASRWQGEVVAVKTNRGYLLGIGLSIPGVTLQSGYQLGIDLAVCDDDGDGRKSLLISSGYKGEFWLTMDNFMQATLQ